MSCNDAHRDKFVECQALAHGFPAASMQEQRRAANVANQQGMDGAVTDTNAAGKTKLLHNMMEKQGLQLIRPSHSDASGMPSPSHQQGYAAVTNHMAAKGMLDASELSNTAQNKQADPQVRQAAGDLFMRQRLGETKRQAGGQKSAPAQTSAQGPQHCPNCGEFMGQSHVCRRTATAAQVQQHIASSLGVTDQTISSVQAERLAGEAHRNGAIQVRHPSSGEVVAVSLDALPMALAAGWEPPDWTASGMVVTGSGLHARLPASAGLPSVPDDQPGREHGLAASLPVADAVFQARIGAQTQTQAGILGGELVTAKGLWGREYFVKAGGKTIDVAGETLTYGSTVPISSTRDYSSARLEGPPTIKIGKSLPVAATLLITGRISVDPDGLTRLLDTNGSTLSAYDPVSNTTADAIGYPDGYSAQLAVLAGHLAVFPTTDAPQALERDVSAVRSGNKSGLAVIDSMYLTLKEFADTQGGFNAKGVLLPEHIASRTENFTADNMADLEESALDDEQFGVGMEHVFQQMAEMSLAALDQMAVDRTDNPNLSVTDEENAIYETFAQSAGVFGDSVNATPAGAAAARYLEVGAFDENHSDKIAAAHSLLLEMQDAAAGGNKAYYFAESAATSTNGSVLPRRPADAKLLVDQVRSLAGDLFIESPSLVGTTNIHVSQQMPLRDADRARLVAVADALRGFESRVDGEAGHGILMVTATQFTRAERKSNGQFDEDLRHAASGFVAELAASTDLSDADFVALGQGMPFTMIREESADAVKYIGGLAAIANGAMPYDLADAATKQALRDTGNSMYGIPDRFGGVKTAGRIFVSASDDPDESASTNTSNERHNAVDFAQQLLITAAGSRAQAMCANCKQFRGPQHRCPPTTTSGNIPSDVLAQHPTLRAIENRDLFPDEWEAIMNAATRVFQDPASSTALRDAASDCLYARPSDTRLEQIARDFTKIMVEEDDASILSGITANAAIDPAATLAADQAAISAAYPNGFIEEGEYEPDTSSTNDDEYDYGSSPEAFSPSPYRPQPIADVPFTAGIVDASIVGISSSAYSVKKTIPEWKASESGLGSGDVGTVVQVGNEEVKIGSFIRSKGMASSARQTGFVPMPASYRVVAGRTTGAALQQLMEGEVVENRAGKTELYSAGRTRLLAVYDPETHRVASTSGGVSLSGSKYNPDTSEVAVILAHHILHPTTLEDRALKTDLGNIQSGLSQATVAMDSADLVIQQALTKNPPTWGGSVMTTRCPLCGEWAGSSHQCAASGQLVEPQGTVRSVIRLPRETPATIAASLLASPGINALSLGDPTKLSSDDADRIVSSARLLANYGSLPIKYVAQADAAAAINVGDAAQSNAAAAWATALQDMVGGATTAPPTPAAASRPPAPAPPPVASVTTAIAPPPVAPVPSVVAPVPSAVSVAAVSAPSAIAVAQPPVAATVDQTQVAQILSGMMGQMQEMGRNAPGAAQTDDMRALQQAVTLLAQSVSSMAVQQQGVVAAVLDQQARQGNQSQELAQEVRALQQQLQGIHAGVGGQPVAAASRPKAAAAAAAPKTNGRAGLVSYRPSQTPRVTEIEKLLTAKMPAPDPEMKNLPPVIRQHMDNLPQETIPAIDPDYVVNKEITKFMTIINSMVEASSKAPDHLRHRMRVFGAYGPSGTGKSSLFRQIAAQIKVVNTDGSITQGVGFHPVQISPKTNLSNLLGTTALKDGSTIPVLGPVGLALAQGGVLLLDEVVRNPDTVNAIQDAIEYGSFTIESPEAGKITIPVANVIVGMTWNPGYEGSPDRPGMAVTERILTMQLASPPEDEIKERLKKSVASMAGVEPTKDQMDAAYSFWNDIRIATQDSVSKRRQVGANNAFDPTPEERSLTRFLTTAVITGDWDLAAEQFYVYCDQTPVSDRTKQVGIIKAFFEARIGSNTAIKRKVAGRSPTQRS